MNIFDCFADLTSYISLGTPCWTVCISRSTYILWNGYGRMNLLCTVNRVLTSVSAVDSEIETYTDLKHVFQI